MMTSMMQGNAFIVLLKGLQEFYASWRLDKGLFNSCVCVGGGWGGRGGVAKNWKGTQYLSNLQAGPGNCKNR